MVKLFKNPMTIWAKWLLLASWLELKNKRNKLQIEYMAFLSGCRVGYANRVYPYTILANVDLGDFTYVADHCTLSQTRIGKFCSIGPYVKCGLGIHPSRLFVSTHPAFYSDLQQCGVTFVNKGKFTERLPVEIGNDVWIGAGSTIVDGVKVGDGAIIAAGSVVVKDVPPYAVVGGVPAKLIRYRFDEDSIKKLLLLKWWDKDRKWIQARVDKFCNINDLLEREP